MSTCSSISSRTIPCSTRSNTGGVQAGLKNLDADRPNAVVLVSDGGANIGPTEHGDFLKLLDKTDVRVFTFVMGQGANRPLLGRLAEDSGVLNTIWVGGAAIAARGEHGWMRTVYLAAVVAGLAKIVFEAWTGISIFTDPDALGGQPLVLAHALGSLSGSAMLYSGRPRRPRAWVGDHRPGGVGVDAFVGP